MVKIEAETVEQNISAKNTNLKKARIRTSDASGRCITHFPKIRVSPQAFKDAFLK
jgi:hypothetical protein